MLSLAIDTVLVRRVDPGALANTGTAVICMEGSFASFHQTELAVYAVMLVGLKVWALLSNSSHNKEVRKDWKESDGLGCFEKVVVVDTRSHHDSTGMALRGILSSRFFDAWWTIYRAQKPPVNPGSG